MTIALGNFAIMYSTMVRLANELCFDIMFWQTKSLCTPLLCKVNMFTTFSESLGYYCIAYCCNFLHKYLRNFYPHLILIVTLMNRSKVFQELSLHLQSHTSIH